MKRPLLFPIVFFLLGVILADKLLAGFSLTFKILIPVLAVSLLSLAATIKTKKLFPVVLLFLFFALGIFRLCSFMNVWENDVSQFIPSDNEKVFISGMISTEPVYAIGEHYDTVSFSLAAENIIFNEQEMPVSGKIRTYVYDPRESFQIGDIIAAEGKLSIPRGRTNPAGFDYKNFLKYQGVGAVLSISKGDLVGVVGASKNPVMLFRRYLSKAKHKALRALGKNLSGEKRDLVESILLGQRQGLDNSTKDLFAKTGTMHIIAVSGLHVGIIGAAVLAVMLFLRFPKKIAYVITILGIFSFALMSGARPSAMRAAIMLSFLLLSQVLDRRVDIVSSLFLSAFIIVFAAPGQLFTPGFILSYMAVLSIIYLTPVFDLVTKPPGVERPLSFLQKSISVSLAVWIGTLPIVTSYFNIISPSVVIANLVAIPVLFLLILLGGLSVLLGSFTFLGVIAGYAAAVLGWIIDSYFFILGMISKCPFAYFKISSPAGIVVSTYYILLVVLVLYCSGKTSDIKGRRNKIFIFFLVASNLFVWNQVVKGMPPKEVEVTFFDTGKSDAALMEFPDGEVVLIDGGSGGLESGSADHGRNVIAPYLIERGINKIDCIIMSHPHEDHIGGLFYITRNFNVGTLVTADQDYSGSWYYEDYLDLVRQKGIRHIEVTRGDVVKGIGSLEV